MGNIYVCSDIHGRYDRYKQIFDIVTNNDTLYILGDVIDRHEYGIKILQDMMHKENIKFIIGNHEHMMYYSLMDDSMYNNHNQQCYLYTWLDPRNGGLFTKNEYDKLDQYNKNLIKNYLENAYLYKRITVNNQSILLTHAGAHSSFVKDYLQFKDVSRDTSYNIVWNSLFSNGMLDSSKLEDYTLDDLYIVGHTMVQRISCRDDFRILNMESTILKSNIKFIDGGCALDKDSNIVNSLNLLCLNDSKEYHFI